jgi:hypothetical protein
VVVLAPAAARAWEWAPALVRAMAQVMEPVLVSALVLAEVMATRLPVALMIRSSEW